MSVSSPSCLLDLSDTFVLGSGTVSIDPSKSLVLLLLYRPKGAFLLPKIRKHVDEGLEAAAMRATKRKTGYECHLLKNKHPNQGANPGRSLQYTEPIAIQQKVCQGIRRLVFWYVAQVDSSDACISDTQEGGEDFVVCWVGINIASAMMAFEEERKIVASAVDAFLA
ncbi:hypothetical protein MMC07_009722 [Pseudocyphellaria aurata]|nr:hypothetical protein [Pseudocyphellaria aurata]